MSTHRRTLRTASIGAGGYRRLGPSAPEPHQVRPDLLSAAAVADDADVLLGVAHLSDLHVCDAQSPARVEYLDRFADPDSPLAGSVGEIGTYRPQEILTAQVVEAMVRSVQGVVAGPVGRRPLDVAIVTGDNTDNAQGNELDWYLNLLEGGIVRADSGDRTAFEGVGGAYDEDDRYWHPDPSILDQPKQRYGFPSAAGLHHAVRQEFRAAGLPIPWLAVHGNHDRLLQGTLPATGLLAGVSVGADKAVRLPPDWAADRVSSLLSGLEGCDPRAIAQLGQAPGRRITADPSRRVISRADFVAAHFRPGASPIGHGFSAAHAPAGRAFYRFDHGAVTIFTLDTVNQHGGWEGSLDRDQFHWLGQQLALADQERRYVVLASHHPLARLVNDRTDGSGRRVLAGEVEQLLARHPCVVLWLSGHTHATAITAHASWWDVTAPSLIDWPQQARVVELLRRDDGYLLIATTMLDHAGEAPWQGSVEGVVALAGLSRELAANDWQARHLPLEENPRGGRLRDRNTVLLLPDPFGSTAALRAAADVG